MCDSTDHISPKTGLSPTVTISKAGGSFGSPAGAVSELGNGWYLVAGNATDTNTLGSLILHATATGADPTDREYEIVAFDPQDSVRGGFTALPNATAGASGGLPLSVDSSGRVDVLKINGTNQTAGDLAARLPASLTANGNMKSSLVEILTTALTETAGQIAAGFKQFFNVASPSGTQNLIPRVTLVDTTTANTDMRGTDNAALAATALSTAIWTSARAGYLDVLNGIVNAIAIATEGRILDETDGTQVLQAIVNKINSVDADLSGLSVAAIAQAVRDVSLSGAAAGGLGAGTSTLLTRLSSALTVTAGKVDVNDKTGFALSGSQTFSNTGTWTGNIVGAISTATTVTNPVTAGTVSDKTGYSLLTSPPTAAAIAIAVEAAILNEADGQQVLQAIINKINSVDADLSGLSIAAIAQAVRDYALSGASAGSIGAGISSLLSRPAPSNPSDYARNNVIPSWYTAPAGTVTLASGQANLVAAALLDLSDGVETSLTVRQFLRGSAAVLLGKSSNGGATFRDTGDTKNRVVGTVDGSGNRTAVTRDLT